MTTVSAVKTELLRVVVQQYLQLKPLSTLWDGWPVGCCSICLHEDFLALARAYFPSADPIRGNFDGHYHYFLIDDDGIIIDPTVGQFIGAPDARVTLPGDPLYERYTWEYPDCELDL